MPAPILLLGLTAASTAGSGYLLNRSTLGDPNLEPKLFGKLDTRVATGVVGLAGLLLGGPLVAAIGAGLVGSSIVNMDTSKLVKQGLESFLQNQAAQIPANVPAQIPEQPIPPVPTAPIDQPGQPEVLPPGLLSQFFSSFAV